MSLIKETAAKFGGKIPNFQVTHVIVYSDLTPTHSRRCVGSSNWLQIMKAGDAGTAGSSLRGDESDPVYQAHRALLEDWKRSSGKAEWCRQYEAVSEHPIYAPR